MSKGKKITLWALSILLAGLFLFAGGFGLLHPDTSRSAFAHYGYSPWFATFIGACEVLGAICLLIPRLAGLAAAGLSIIMVGAVYTHVSHQELSHAPLPFGKRPRGAFFTTTASKMLLRVAE